MNVADDAEWSHLTLRWWDLLEGLRGRYLREKKRGRFTDSMRYDVARQLQVWLAIMPLSSTPRSVPRTAVPSFRGLWFIYRYPSQSIWWSNEFLYSNRLTSTTSFAATVPGEHVVPKLIWSRSNLRHGRPSRLLLEASFCRTSLLSMSILVPSSRNRKHRTRIHIWR